MPPSSDPPSGGVWKARRSQEDEMKTETMRPSPVESEIQIGPYRLRRIDRHTIEIMNDGEGGYFDEADLIKVVGQFVSDWL